MANQFKPPSICQNCRYNTTTDTEQGKPPRTFHYIAKGPVRVWICNECNDKRKKNIGAIGV